MQTYYQRTISFEWEIQVFRHLFHHLVSAHIEFRHQGTFRRVIARMDDSTVCLRCAGADILFFFQKHGAALIFRKRSGDTAADDAASDNHYVVCISVHTVILHYLY